MARVTVVVEAAEGSGTLITVAAALIQGRDVMAVPGPITSPTSVGTNRLIRDGAEPLLDPADLLAHFPEVVVETVAGADVPTTPGTAPTIFTAFTTPVPIPAGLSPEEQAMAEALQDGPLAIDALILRLAVSPAQALVAVSGLELRGVASHERGRVTWAVEGEGTRARLK